MNTLTTAQSSALADAAQGRVLFHNGLWGASMGYVWAGPTPGRGSGPVPKKVGDALDSLSRLGFVRVLPGASGTDVPVVATESGKAALGSRFASPVAS
ncbi:hypothetical protein [Actinocrispum sp. NPDC049592]|uniref:hypothetical protein n=1 Tax=Actinocrispum sp. NPDC049592 TaxID=3154835 RepID=UPI003414D504